ncbi:hypothetical protein [Paraburkholderia sp. RL17-373-BIF-A]|uniref:hypothetical protein n=1 Tax=Paraburkholderia sp. RL17-373-BIF-A TaxID=3031629 RepID=UPI0038B99FF1
MRNCSDRTAGRGKSELLASLPEPLIGRDEAIADIIRALKGAPIVTLLGPGGIGKTQLGLAVARSIAAAAGMDVCFITLPRWTTRRVWSARLPKLWAQGARMATFRFNRWLPRSGAKVCAYRPACCTRNIGLRRTHSV